MKLREEKKQHAVSFPFLFTASFLASLSLHLINFDGSRVERGRYLLLLVVSSAEHKSSKNASKITC